MIEIVSIFCSIYHIQWSATYKTCKNDKQMGFSISSRGVVSSTSNHNSWKNKSRLAPLSGSCHVCSSLHWVCPLSSIASFYYWQQKTTQNCQNCYFIISCNFVSLFIDTFVILYIRWNKKKIDVCAQVVWFFFTVTNKLCFLYCQ